MSGIASSDRLTFDQLSGWRNAICRDILPLEIDAAQDPGFFGAIDHRAFGEVLLSRISSGPQRVLHGAAAPGEAGCLLVNLLVSGEGSTSQFGRTLQLGPRSLFFHDGGSPYDMDLRTRFEFVSLRLPTALARKYVERPDLAAVRRLNGGNAAGDAAADLLDTLARRIEGLDEPAVLAINAALLALIGSACAHYASSPARSCQQASFVRVMQIIDRHLHDPELRPARVAAAAGLTMRQLNRLFQKHGTTVSGVIRGKRLEGARLDLISRRGITRTIGEIAYAWGFGNLSHFSERFRDSYGLTPSEARNRTIM